MGVPTPGHILACSTSVTRALVSVEAAKYKPPQNTAVGGDDDSTTMRSPVLDAGKRPYYGKNECLHQAASLSAARLKRRQLPVRTRSRPWLPSGYDAGYVAAVRSETRSLRPSATHKGMTMEIEFLS